jgi:hypothetical protein
MSYLAATTVGLAIGLFLGYPLGQRRGLIDGLGHLRDAMAGDLTADVEVASCVRLGDTERALAILDARLDGAILQLAAAKQNLGYLVAPTNADRGDALALAKTYRSIVPPAGRDARAVSNALQNVPVGDKASLSPGIARLAERGGQ